MSRSSKGAPQATGYDIFILGISLLSLVNLVLLLLPLSSEVSNLVLIVDVFLSIILLGDFAYRLITAPDKREYLIGQLGILDFLGSLPLPGLRLVRLFRVVKVIKIVRVEGGGTLLHRVASQRSSSALLTVAFLTIALLEFGGIYVLRTELRDADSNIRSASDALWWGYVTITTVGYGDRYPVTNGGRLVGIMVLTIGVGLFSIITGFFATAFVASGKDEEGDQAGAANEAVLNEIVALRQEVAELRRQLLPQRDSAAVDD